MARILVPCPDCQSKVRLPANPDLWMRVTCAECGTQLEIVDDEPWQLDFAEDLEEDEEALYDSSVDDDDDGVEFEDLDEDLEDKDSFIY
jgi:lysine biosynthesis protein LysW